MPIESLPPPAAFGTSSETRRGSAARIVEPALEQAIAVMARVSVIAARLGGSL